MGIPQLALSRATLDRAAEHRTDKDWLDAAWSDPGTRVLVVAEGKARYTAGAEGPQLHLVSPGETPPGERYLLGVNSAGTAHFAVAAAELPPHDGEVADLRTLGGLLSDEQAGMMVHAVGLAHWHRSHPRCARCGEPTDVAQEGHVRHCAACGADHFPRTDPAVIMMVIDRQDRCLLARNSAWPEKRFSSLAGFVEPGESLEQAVAREVLEEVGVPVEDAVYVGSQPWPFPASLMLGFHARAVSDRVRIDNDEIAEARWFTRAELKSAIESGEVLPPGGISIARHLLELWYGEPIPEEHKW